MNNLENKIYLRYENSDELISLLKKFNLDKIVSKILVFIDRKIANNELHDICRISGIVLYDFNLILTTIQEPEIKIKLEYLLSDLFHEYILKIEEISNSKELLNEIVENLKVLCEFKNYNFIQLESLLSLKRHSVIIRKSKFSLYYEWQKTNYELQEIAKDLLDKRFIYSVNEFKSLFKPEPSLVRFNREKMDEIIVMFRILKDKKLIIPRGKGSSGHFTAFVKYAIDNEEKIFIETKINKLHERIKKNITRYNIIKEKIEKILVGNTN